MPPFETLSKEELYIQAVQLHGENEQLKFQLAQFNKLVFGQKRERFIVSDSAIQATLFNPNPPLVVSVAPVAQTGPKPKGQKAGVPNPNHKGRNAFPAHLPRVVEVLLPEVVEANPGHFAKIGQEITETLDYAPARLFVKQRIRERFVAKPENEIIALIAEQVAEQVAVAQIAPTTEISENVSVANIGDAQNNATEPSTEPIIVPVVPKYTEGVYIAPMPSRPLPKAIAEAGLLAQIQIDKFIDHLPIDRQAKRWKRESGINITGSTVIEWSIGTYNLLLPLYDKLVELVFNCTYLQADESTIRCLQDAPIGKSHTSYQWVYRNVYKVSLRRTPSCGIRTCVLPLRQIKNKKKW